jgi:hypothetical protein
MLTKEKQARLERNSDGLGRVSEKLAELTWELARVRHFADFLAWMFFKNEWHKIRRFYSGSKSRPNLLESNLPSVLDAVEYFHAEGELNFALITDLTSFIDIGDLLLVTENKIEVVECKSGDTQRRVFEFIEKLRADDFDPAKVDYSDKDNKFFDQVERTLRQFERGSDAISFVNTEKGVDPFTKMEINLLISDASPDYYFDKLIVLVEESLKDDSAYDIVEDIIYLAAYRNSKIERSRFIFEYMAHGTLENYITVDLMELLYAPLKEPLLFKPLGKEALFDLMFGRLKVYLALDLDKLISLFNEKGVSARWLSEKETKQHKSRGGPKPFVYKKRAIQVSTNGITLILGTTFTVHLLLDNMNPSALVERYATLS